MAGSKQPSSSNRLTSLIIGLSWYRPRLVYMKYPVWLLFLAARFLILSRMLFALLKTCMGMLSLISLPCFISKALSGAFSTMNHGSGYAMPSNAGPGLMDVYPGMLV